MQENKVPPVDRALVEWLEKQFLNRLPSYPTDDLNAINVSIGQQQVVRLLRHHYEEQTTNSTPIR